MPTRSRASTPIPVLRAAPLITLLLAALAGALLLAAAAEAKPRKEPRLSVSRISSPPPTAEVGETFELEGILRNKGRKRARDVEVRLELRGRGADGKRIGERRVGRVKARSRKPFTIGGTVPPSLAPPDRDSQAGPFRVLACVHKRGNHGKLKCKRARGKLLIEPSPEFRPGARSLDDPLFPQIGNGGYDAGHYAIELDYDPATNRFRDGTKTTITATATQDLSELSLDFQDLDVAAVSVDGEAAEFRQREAKPPLSSNPEVTQPMKLIVTPAHGIREGEQFELVVSYTGSPQEITDPDTSIEGWIRACYPQGDDQACDGSFVVNEPIGAQSWFPSNNYPTDKASFETILTVPRTHTAFGIGELAEPASDNGDGTWSWHWREDDPTATYLTTATVGLFDYSEESMVESLTDAELDVYRGVESSATSAQLDDINAKFDRIPSMLNFLSDRWGAYPFDSIGGVADRVEGVGYALEVQTKPHFAGRFDGSAPNVGTATLLHEVAHQWIGNSVSPASWLEIWFNEGWAEWATWYWDHEANGNPVAPADQFTLNYTPGEKWEIAPAVLDDDPANLFAHFPVYVRPAMMLEGYRQIVGDAKLFSLARSLLGRYRYATVGTEQFVNRAIANSGLTGADRERLAEYFEQWLYREGQPTITPADFATTSR